MHEVAGLEYEERGNGTPVLLIHGAIIGDAFAPMMDEPALSGYRLIRYRRRGYGDSLPPSAAPRMEEQAADAIALLKELGVSRAHVVGHSGGGPIAVQLAVDAPDLVQSLVLLEPALQTAPMAGAFDEMVAPLVEMHRAGQSAKAVHLWMRSASVAGSGWGQSIEQLLPGAAQQAEQDAAGTFEADLACLRHWDFEVVGSLVTQPVLYVVGSLSAPSQEPVRALVEAAVPTSTYAVVDDADHSLQMTRPAAVAHTIAEFLGGLS